MSLTINYLGKEKEISFESFDSVNKIIKCTFEEQGLNEIEIPYILELDDSFKIENFEIYLLTKSDLHENDIYEVFDYDRKVRMGWCIPIQALDSNEHEYASNEHFLKCAYVGIINLLKDCPKCFLYSPSVDITYRLKLSEFFHDSTVMLIICKTTTPNGTQLYIKDWLPSLYLYGYTLLHEKNPDLHLHRGNSPKNKKLNIFKVSSDLSKNDYIENIFSKILGFEKEPLLSFFYIYQIVELLLEEVYIHEQKSLMRKLIKHSKDLSKTREIMDKWNDLKSEKNRLGKLINKYVSLENHQQLKTTCNELLENMNSEKGDNFNQYFYNVRNYIFHQFRNIPSESKPLIKEIVNEALIVIVHFLKSFKYPN